MSIKGLNIEFKRSFLIEVKKFPDIWTANTKGIKKRPEFSEIESLLKYPMVNLSLLWTTLRKKYYRIVFKKTIERDFQVPKWRLFHDMSFMYESVKKIIQSKLGGLSPPLLRPSSKNLQISCPCCMRISFPDQNIDVDPVDPSETLDINLNMGLPLTNWEPQEESNCSTDVEDIWTYNPQSEIEQSNSIPNHNETRSGSANSSVNDSEIAADITCTETLEIEDDSSVEFVEDHLQNVPCDPKPHVISTLPFRKSQKQVPPPSNVTQYTIVQRDKPQKPQPYPFTTFSDCRSLERKQIIEAIRDHPVLYSYNKAHFKHKSVVKAWEAVAQEVTSIPLHLIKSRWRVIKQRYLKELVVERYSNIKSQWDSFEDMSFMLPFMMTDLEEIDRTRRDIATSLGKNTEEVTNEEKRAVASIAILDNFDEGSKTRLTPSPHQEMSELERAIASIAKPNHAQNLKVLPVLQNKPHQTISEQERAVVPILSPSLVENQHVLPILQNRPVKVTAVQVCQPTDRNEDFNSHDREKSMNIYTQLKSMSNIDLGPQIVQELNEMSTEPLTLTQKRKKGPVPILPKSILPKENASISGSTEALIKNDRSILKVMQTKKATGQAYERVDLTGDDEEPPIKRLSKYQLYYSQTRVENPDLLKKSQSSDATKGNVDDVITLDEDDVSVGSYEEVLVYITEDQEDVDKS